MGTEKNESRLVEAAYKGANYGATVRGYWGERIWPFVVRLPVCGGGPGSGAEREVCAYADLHEGVVGVVGSESPRGVYGWVLVRSEVGYRAELFKS